MLVLPEINFLHLASACINILHLILPESLYKMSLWKNEWWLKLQIVTSLRLNRRIIVLILAASGPPLPLPPTMVIARLDRRINPPPPPTGGGRGEGTMTIGGGGPAGLYHIYIDKFMDKYSIKTYCTYTEKLCVYIPFFWNKPPTDWLVSSNCDAVAFYPGIDPEL